MCNEDTFTFNNSAAAGGGGNNNNIILFLLFTLHNIVLTSLGIYNSNACRGGQQTVDQNTRQIHKGGMCGQYNVRATARETHDNTKDTPAPRIEIKISDPADNGTRRWMMLMMMIIIIIIIIITIITIIITIIIVVVIIIIIIIIIIVIIIIMMRR